MSPSSIVKVNVSGGTDEADELLSGKELIMVDELLVAMLDDMDSATDDAPALGIDAALLLETSIGSAVQPANAAPIKRPFNITLPNLSITFKHLVFILLKIEPFNANDE